MKVIKRITPHMIGLIMVLLLFLVPAVAEEASKNAPELTKKECQEVINKIIPLLKDNYVFPDIGIKIGDHLRTLMKKDAFKDITTREDFAKRLTEEIRSVSNDKHMRVRVSQPQAVQRDRKDPLLAWHMRQMMEKKENTGFKTVELLEGNVGYLDFRYFGSPDGGKRVVAAAMTFLENTDAIIVDMRKNGGGSPQMVALVCSYFFDKKVHLNSLYWRKGDITQDFWTLDKIDGKRRADVPLFVLTSSRTFSGAEEFCYNMQTQKRATLIGEVTGGGANPGDGFPITDSFVTFIPTGRAINPITKTNWEGTGVKPDIEIEADKALDKAHELAKIAAAEFAEKKVTALTKEIETLHSKWKKTVELYTANPTKENEMQLHEVLKSGLESDMMNENQINDLGYTFLGQKKNDLAITIFTFNTKAFPDSANAFDSLAEAYMEKGDTAEAINNYKKSLEIDPTSKSGQAMLKKLQEAAGKKAQKQK